MNKDYYLPLKSTDNCHSKILEEIHSSKNWIVKYNFDVLPINPIVFLSSFLFQVIRKFNGIPVVLKMNPMTWYDWHVDSDRLCTINSLISGFESKSFFGNKVNNDIISLTELKYELGRYYLLNTQSSHAVLNLSDERYVLSIGFKNHSYQTIREYLENNNL